MLLDGKRISRERIFSECPTYTMFFKRVRKQILFLQPRTTDKYTALRLYPPVPINTRFCRKTTTLPVGGGPDGRSPLLVREGMPVAYSVYHMQRRKDLYGPDPLAFRPERWDSSELASTGWVYLPFNGGPRLCLGSKSGHSLDLC